MDTLESLNHTVWECKYHVVFMSTLVRNVPFLRSIEMSPSVGLSNEAAERALHPG